MTCQYPPLEPSGTTPFALAATLAQLLVRESLTKLYGQCPSVFEHAEYVLVRWASTLPRLHEEHDRAKGASPWTLISNGIAAGVGLLWALNPDLGSHKGRDGTKED